LVFVAPIKIKANPQQGRRGGNREDNRRKIKGTNSK